MLTGVWYQIDKNSSSAYPQRFMQIMHRMDRRYAALTAEEFAHWLDPDFAPKVGERRAPYRGHLLEAWAWSDADETDPDTIEIILLLRHEPGTDMAHLVMLGWDPRRDPPRELSEQLLDDTIVQILTKGSEWLAGQEDGEQQPLTKFYATRPFKMTNPLVKALHDRIYQYALDGESSTGGTLRLELLREERGHSSARWECSLYKSV